MASNAPTPRFASGSDVESLSYFISPLLKANGGRWALGMDGQALEREFKFKTFAKTWVNICINVTSTIRCIQTPTVFDFTTLGKETHTLINK